MEQTWSFDVDAHTLQCEGVYGVVACTDHGEVYLQDDRNDQTLLLFPC